jgi:hypothetical protein
LPSTSWSLSILLFLNLNIILFWEFYFFHSLCMPKPPCLMNTTEKNVYQNDRLFHYLDQTIFHISVFLRICNIRFTLVWADENACIRTKFVTKTHDKISCLRVCIIQSFTKVSKRDRRIRGVRWWWPLQEIINAVPLPRYEFKTIHIYRISICAMTVTDV